jgi:hypothetical protein
MKTAIWHALRGGATVFLVLGAATAHAQTRDVEEIVNTGERSAENSSRLTFSTGVDYSTGKYGDPIRTDILVVPASLRYRASDTLTVSASMPYIRIKGPDVVLGPDDKPLPGFPIASNVRSGLGDLSLSATYSVPTGKDSPWLIDATARVKLPTSSKSQGVTTGKTDVSLGLDISYLTGNWAPFIDIGYRLPGSPAGVELRNSPTVSVGVTRLLKKGAFIVSYDYERALSALSEDGHSIFAALTKPASKRISITGYGIVGLSSGAPAVEGGLLLSFKLD